MSKGELREGSDGSFTFWRAPRLYRFLLNDGATLDVLATRDDSDVRAAVVARTGGTIAGVADLGEQPESTTKGNP